MSSDDDSPGWSGADKSPLVVMQPRQEGSGAAAATRTAGSLVLIIFMLISAILMVLAITMHNIYKGRLVDEVKINPEARCLVMYRDALAEARDSRPISDPPLLMPENVQLQVYPDRPTPTVLAASDPENSDPEKLNAAPSVDDEGRDRTAQEDGRCDSLPEPREGEARMYGPHPQLEFDRLRAHNETLGKDNRDRVAAEERARDARRPTQPGLPGFPG